MSAYIDVLIVVNTVRGYDTYSAYLRDEAEPIVPLGSHNPEREACVALADRGFAGPVRFMRDWNGPASMTFKDLRMTAAKTTEAAEKKVPRSRRTAPTAPAFALGHAT